MNKNIIFALCLSAATAQAQGLSVYFERCYIDVPASAKLAKHELFDAYGKNVKEGKAAVLAACKAKLDATAAGECEKAAKAGSFNSFCETGIYIPF